MIEHRLDPLVVQEQLLANRKQFITYNITRMRELIRYLPAKKLELFHTVPLLLHVNSPELPGYVHDPQTPSGIYRFYDSGFWKLAKKRLGINIQKIRSFVSKSFSIKGIYLIGSAGSMGHTDYGGFDYWLVIDRGSISEIQRRLLVKKLSIIENWAEETYGRDLTFFVLDSEQMRQNDFSGIDEEGFRTTQKSLLKEEFYRTFILIAGQIPYWAILPVGLNDLDYRAWIETASRLSDDNFVSSDYVDFGNLTSIKSEECFGAVLWQIYKARDNPAESLIKALLIAQHYFFQKQEGLLCDITKERMPESRLDSYLVDPDTLAFERVLRFCESMDDKDGLDLLRQCIYLCIAGYPEPSHLDEDSPKSQLLKHYVKAWSWKSDRVNRLQSYALWTEDERLRFEDSIVKKLWFLYKRIFRSMGKTERHMGMPYQDVAVLTHRIAGRFRKKQGKVAQCSVFLLTKGDSLSMFIAYEQETSGANMWAAYDSSVKRSDDNERVFFVAPALLHVLGWIVVNRLCKGKLSSITFQHVQSPISPKRAQQLLEALFSFFSDDSLPLNYTHSDPPCVKVFAALDAGRFTDDHTLRFADFLVQNSWGEMFFHSLALTHIENNLLKCHEIAKQIWLYLQEASSGESQYQIYDFRTTEHATTASTIEDFMRSFQKTGARDLKTQETERKAQLEFDEMETQDPLLDLF